MKRWESFTHFQKVEFIYTLKGKPFSKLQLDRLL